MLVAGQVTEAAGVGHQTLVGQVGGHLVQARAGGHVKKDVLAGCGRRGGQKVVGLPGQPAAAGHGQQQKQPHKAQKGFHAGLRCCGARARKDSRMRTAACWSSTVLRRRASSPAARRSSQASSELSSSDIK